MKKSGLLLSIYGMLAISCCHLDAMSIDFKFEEMRYPAITLPIYKICVYETQSDSPDQANNNLIGQISFVKNLIMHLSVAERYRKQGVGMELLVRSLEKIRHEGYKKAEWVATDSIAFYIRVGAKLKERPKSCTIWAKVEYSADMEFDFERDGDPRLNAQKFKQHFIAYK